MKRKIVAIIAARMGSSRLQGKVLLEPIRSKPLLELMIERVKKVKEIDVIVVATTNRPKDYAIVELCKKLNVEVFRGDEEDVLNRFYLAASKYNANIIVRLTGDCPLIDPEIISSVIKTFKMDDYDLVSNVVERTFPRGMDTEVMSFDFLSRLNQVVLEKSYREHVTYYAYINPDGFKIKNTIADKSVNRPDLRLTVDTSEDYKVVSAIFQKLYKGEIFGLDKIIEYLDKHPEIVSMNKEVEQKSLR